eukprot:11135229-Karenia_brevis.AAC.1
MVYVMGYFSEISLVNRLEDKSAFKWARPPWDTKHDEAHIVDNIPRADAPNIYEVPSDGSKAFPADLTNMTRLDQMAERHQA